MQLLILFLCQSSLLCQPEARTLPGASSAFDMRERGNRKHDSATTCFSTPATAGAVKKHMLDVVFCDLSDLMRHEASSQYGGSSNGRDVIIRRMPCSPCFSAHPDNSTREQLIERLAEVVESCLFCKASVRLLIVQAALPGEVACGTNTILLIPQNELDIDDS